jgi:hypothetical protein
MHQIISVSETLAQLLTPPWGTVQGPGASGKDSVSVFPALSHCKNRYPTSGTDEKVRKSVC